MTSRKPKEFFEIAGKAFHIVRVDEYFPMGYIPDEFKKYEKIAVPYVKRDDYLEFPGESELHNAGSFYSSGIVAHEAERKPGENVFEEGIMKKISAKDLHIFDEMDWYGECFQVLTAHNWIAGAGISQDLKEAVLDIEPEAGSEEARERYRDNWDVYLLERAAYHFASPLSRLWYAANMKSLYYIHYDDLRLGFLWSEYQQRMRSEEDAIRGGRLVNAGRAGAASRQAAYATRNAAIIRKMKELIESGHSMSRAASLALASGLGTSAEANRKLFNRHQQNE